MPDLNQKLSRTIEAIMCWYESWGGMVYVAYSGGLDSTVLLHIVRFIYPEVPAVFMNTGIEFPEIVRFVRSTKNVIELHPKIYFKQFVDKYGWPIINKEVAMAVGRYRTTKREDQKEYRLHGRWENGKHLKAGMIPKKWQYLIHAPFGISAECCSFLKHGPLKRFAKTHGLNPMIGMMTGDGNTRQRVSKSSGGNCNMYDRKAPVSWPLLNWTKQDVLEYVRIFNVPVCDVYNMGYDRTGCMFCMFGLEKEAAATGSNRFQKMRTTHPKHWDAVINKMGGRSVLEFLNIPFE